MNQVRIEVEFFENNGRSHGIIEVDDLTDLQKLGQQLIDGTYKVQLTPSQSRQYEYFDIKASSYKDIVEQIEEQIEGEVINFSIGGPHDFALFVDWDHQNLPAIVPYCHALSLEPERFEFFCKYFYDIEREMAIDVIDFLRNIPENKWKGFIIYAWARNDWMSEVFNEDFDILSEATKCYFNLRHYRNVREFVEKEIRASYPDLVDKILVAAFDGSYALSKIDYPFDVIVQGKDIVVIDY